MLCLMSVFAAVWWACLACSSGYIFLIDANIPVYTASLSGASREWR